MASANFQEDVSGENREECQSSKGVLIAICSPDMGCDKGNKHSVTGSSHPASEQRCRAEAQFSKHCYLVRGGTAGHTDAASLCVGQSPSILDLIQGWTSWMDSRSDCATGETSGTTTIVHFIQDHKARLMPSQGSCSPL